MNIRFRRTALFVCAGVGLLSCVSTNAATIGSVNLGNLTDYLFVFTDGSEDANWQGATKGFAGDVAVNGILATERTSGTVPYAGTLYTNAATQGAWQNILNANVGQAFSATSEVARLAGLNNDLTSAFLQIDALSATPGFTSVASTALDGLNTQNGIPETYVINVTSAFTVSTQIDITGDAFDAYILRWDTDALSINGYQGEVKFQSGGSIVPHGGLIPTNFVHVAGDINSSGGGSNPPPPYPQGPRFDDGQGSLITGGADFNGGGFFTGYWLTTGDPITRDTARFGIDPFGVTGSLSNAIFVGGWYTSTDKFSMTSGTSGVYVSPPVPEPSSCVMMLLALGATSALRRR
jgi:PEP-CTERM motif-containing protein